MKNASGWFLLLVLLVGATGCRSPVDVAIGKYSNPPAQVPWDLVSDTKEFGSDVDTLYHASAQGDREAFHALLTIGSFTDGAVSECMPDLTTIVQQHPDMSSQVTMGDPRLTQRYQHGVKEYGTGRGGAEDTSAPPARAH